MLRLIKLSEEYKEQFFDMMREWSDSGEKIIPYSIRKYDYHDFDFYLDHLEVDEADAEDMGLVPDYTFFLYDDSRDRLLGAVNIRKYLDERLMETDGHIGDGIRPSERKKGYGTEMVRLALEECRRMGIYKVLMTCDRSNVASAKTIMNNGGVLENELYVEEDDDPVQRYWIMLQRG